MIDAALKQLWIFWRIHSVKYDRYENLVRFGSIASVLDEF